jgi:hypothetical protein
MSNAGRVPAESADRADNVRESHDGRDARISLHDQAISTLSGDSRTIGQASAHTNAAEAHLPGILLVNDGHSSRNDRHPPFNGGDNRPEGCDRVPSNRPSLTEKGLDDLGKDIADKLSDGRWKFGTPEEKQKLESALKDAEANGQLKVLVAKINLELAKNGSDLHLDLKTQHEQDKFWPELDPFTSWNHYDVNLTAEEGTVLDNINFDGTQTYHPGHYDDRPDRYPIKY